MEITFSKTRNASYLTEDFKARNAANLVKETPKTMTYIVPLTGYQQACLNSGQMSERYIKANIHYFLF